MNRGNVYAKMREYEKAINDQTEVLRLEPNNVRGHLSLGWLLATCPNDRLRDGTRAIEHATKACELLDWGNALTMDALAAAYAETGDFKEAVKLQQRAIELGFADKNEADKARQKLMLYGAGRPYREE